MARLGCCYSKGIGDKLGGSKAVWDMKWDIAHTDEAWGKINLTYQQIFGRDGTVGEISGWRDKLGNDQFIWGMRWELAHNGEAWGKVNGTYTDIVDHNADPGFISGWLDSLANGKNASDLRMAVAYSGDAAAAINEAWKAATGAVAEVWGVPLWQGKFVEGVGLQALRNALAYSYQPTVDAITTVWQTEASQVILPIELKISQDLIASGADLKDVQNIAAEQGSFWNVLKYFNPISTASAAEISPAQAASNRAGAEQYLLNSNVKAFLATIQWAEGGQVDVTYGYNKIADLSKLPTTTAALGKYQIGGGTYRATAKLIGVKDQQEHSQDLVAVQLMITSGVMPKLLSGDLIGAIDAAAGPRGTLWASFPNGTQNVHNLTNQSVIDYYLRHGGSR